VEGIRSRFLAHVPESFRVGDILGLLPVFFLGVKFNLRQRKTRTLHIIGVTGRLTT
jgi:hypothetical protein